MASRRLRVLIADDHPGIVKSLSRLLAFDCDVVGSVADLHALAEATQRLEPDVIVLDLSLPDVDGLKACRQITMDYPEVKVIVFTAADDPNVRQRAFDAGAAAFVHKLAVGGDLLSAVRRLAAAIDPAA
jgi:DNA-binding NarL/FixJ family response regulator